MTEYLVDSNVLIYVVDDADKEKHIKAQKWFEQIAENIDLYYISSQNLREFASVLLKKDKATKENIKKWVANYSNIFVVIHDNKEDIGEAIDLAEKKTHFWDALLAATMKRHNIKTILTEDTKDFKNFKDIAAKSIF